MFLPSASSTTPASGRSDKPTDLGWYSYDRHAEFTATLLADLDLRDATALVHEWGGPIGLRLAVPVGFLVKGRHPVG